jgi:DNA-binding CsgD family transcriptional regulator
VELAGTQPRLRCEVRLLNVACTKPGTRQLTFRNRTLRACPSCATLVERWQAANAVPAAAPVQRPAPRDTADQPRPPRTSELSSRERDVLALYATGSQAKQIARQLSIAVSTVSQYLERIRAKYASVGRAARTRVDLYERAFEDGLITPQSSSADASDSDSHAASFFSELVEALLAVRSVRSPESRKLLLEVFPLREVADVVPFHTEDRLHVIALARTCMRHPDGLSSLLDTVQMIEPGSPEVHRVADIIDRWQAT